MTLQIFREAFTGPYKGIGSPTNLPPGTIADGLNMRKVSSGEGGWKPRKGCSYHNSTAIAAASILSLHLYEHPRNDEDYHFLAQCNGNLYDSSNDPPASGATFAASALSALASSTQPGFSDMVWEHFLYADGEGAPVLWGGDNPYCSGFVVYDASENAYIDYTRRVVDARSDTGAVVLGASSDVFYVCSPQIAEEITLDLGTNVNSNSETMTVSSWQSGSWSNRSASDGTASGGATLAQDGSITWTRSSSDEMKVIGGIMGYWYEVSFSGALSGSVDVISCKVKFDPARLTNKWSGVFEQPLAVRFYDQSTGEYEDYSGHMTNESTSQYIQLDAATTSDFIYVKSTEPLCGIGFGVSPGYENTADAQLDQVEYWDGDSWNALTTDLDDETLDGAEDSSFAQSGTFWWDASGLTVHKRTMDFDSIPGYWYRLSWDAAFDNESDDVRIYFCAVAPFPESLPSYDGVVEFKGRPFLWGDPEYPNRLRYGAYGKADCYSGSDSGYTDALGDMKKVKCARRFYNELIIWKEDSVWLLEGYSPATFGTLRIADTIGLASVKTAWVVEVGYPSMHRDEPLSVAIWMDTDGVYVLDGRKPRKVSLPVDHYFNTEYATAISATDLDDCQAFIDPLNNEYHLLIPDGTELVYNYVADEWYPPWERQVGAPADYLTTGLHFRGTDGRYYTYAGTSAGRVCRLENDTSDKDVSNADVAIDHKIKTRAINLDPKMTPTFEFALRRVWAEFKAITSPTTKTITVNLYKNSITTGSAISTPGSIDLGNSGYRNVIDYVDPNEDRVWTFQLEFRGNRIDLEMEIYNILFMVEGSGEIGIE